MQNLMRANAALLFAGLATFILMGAGQSLYGPALPAFSRIFGITVDSAGLLVSAHWVGCLIGVSAMFVYGAKITPRYVLALMAAGMAALAAQASWGLTLTGAVVFGVGYGCATAVFNPQMLRAFGARGPAMLSLLNATFGVGAIAAPLVFVWLGNNPQTTYAIVAALCALIWLGAGGAGRTEVRAETGSVAPFRPHWGILAFGMMAIGMEACLIGLGPTALIRAGVTEVRAAELLSAFFAAFLLARVGLIFTAHLIGSFTLYTGAMALAALCSMGAVLISPAVFFVGLGVCAGLFFPGYYVTASRKMGEDLRVPPTILLSGLVGGIASPLLLPPLLADMGDRGFFWLLACVSGALTIAAMAMTRGLNR